LLVASRAPASLVDELAERLPAAHRVEDVGRRLDVDVIPQRPAGGQQLGDCSNRVEMAALPAKGPSID
jgi:hypothetical protein